MKPLSIFCYLFIFVTLASCSSNEEPEYPVLVQPASIQSADVDADNQTFEYDDCGRVVSWNCVSNNPTDAASYSAHYSYPDENTIKVTAEEFISNQQQSFERTIQIEETIQLKNGRASSSEGTFIVTFYYDTKKSQVRKTYRLVFDYLPTNHLNTIEHSEVFGIGDELKDNAWDNVWKWVNHLIWENGNLKEYQDYDGSATSYQSTKYEYTEDKVSCPVITPIVIITNRPHHMPLSMQGVFGKNSVNAVKSASSFDNNGNLTLSRKYSYEFENARISKYTETLFTNSAVYNPVTYTVTWTEK